MMITYRSNSASVLLKNPYRFIEVEQPRMVNFLPVFRPKNYNTHLICHKLSYNYLL